jgi:hypothetical protein
MTAEDDIGIRAAQEFLDNKTLAERIQHGPRNEHYVLIEEPEFETAVSHLAANKFVLISLFCSEGFSVNAPQTLFYVFERRNSILVLVRDARGSVSSNAAMALALSLRGHSIPGDSSCMRRILRVSTPSKKRSGMHRSSQKRP